MLKTVVVEGAKAREETSRAPPVKGGGVAPPEKALALREALLLLEAAA